MFMIYFRGHAGYANSVEIVNNKTIGGRSSEQTQIRLNKTYYLNSLHLLHKCVTII